MKLPHDARRSWCQVVTNQLYYLVKTLISRLVWGHQAAYQLVGGSSANTEQDSAPFLHQFYIVCCEVLNQSLAVRRPIFRCVVELPQ